MEELKLKRHPETGELVPEEWKNIEGYSGAYEISNYGRVRSWKNNRHGLKDKENDDPSYLKGRMRDKYYLSVGLYSNGKGKNKRIHRLVAEHFIPNPDNKPEVNHKDWDKLNNFYLNLEWCTRKENMHHASDNGLLEVSEDTRRAIGKANRGSNCASSKLDEEKVKEIRSLKGEGYTNKELGEMFNVHRKTIGKVILKKTWAHV